MVRGGDIRQFILAGRELDPASESNWNILPGGRNNEVSLTGNGRAHTVQRRQTAGVTGCAISVDSLRQDYEFIKRIRDEGAPVPVSLTTADGVTRAGNLTVVGELEYNTGEGTCEFELHGERFDVI